MIWSLWAQWQQIWWLPWAWALLLIGIWFVFVGIPWRVRVMPWAITYILFMSVGYAYHATNFPVAPSTMSSLLSVATFLLFLALPEPKARVCGFEIGYTTYLALIGLVCVGFSLYAPFYLSDRPDAPYLMPVLWNRSMGGAFTVLALAEVDLFWLGLIAALVLARSTPILVFVGTWVAMRSSVLRSYIVALGLAAWVFFRGIPDGTGRLGFWKIYWHEFVGQPLSVKLFGTHLGTLAALLPLVQVKAGIHGGEQLYVWLHNEYFQVLSELGILGLVLFAIAFVEIWLKANRQQRALAIGLLIFMVSDFPLRWMPECLLYWVWIKKNAVGSHVSVKPRSYQGEDDGPYAGTKAVQSRWDFLGTEECQ